MLLAVKSAAAPARPAPGNRPPQPPGLTQPGTPLPTAPDRNPRAPAPELAVLRIPISGRTLFLTVDTVRDLRGLDSQAVLEQVDSGEFLWVWDLNSGTGEIRQLRFLAQEFRDHASVARLTPAQVIQLVLGEHRRHWTGADLARMLHLTRPVIHRLFSRGHLAGKKVKGQWSIDREDLTRFLTDRLLK